MSHAALTAKYRPQTFADVAGQDTLKAILSRASLERRVAPAYLFSGTRGVGKTTVARIFAKALNCRAAPGVEPCNSCDQCRAITAGSAVDVVEIDGASNRGIDDVRRLKEVVGYAPMESAYKIFIIDEAHMLSREAFNALLKTLEEPPPGVTFIMATTEPHKFPATIVSRCQHYVFKRLPETTLVDHLCSVLKKEGVDYEESAVRLIARRGAGSVRDSMSLLGQVLALQDGRLGEESARSVLGLAGQDVFLRMTAAFRDGDSLALSLMLREMLDQGLDMGFFLRELSSLWRNLFILRQSGAAALGVVDLPEDEAKACLAAASGFSLQHIHASWQMTLEGQRRVLTSLEPAMALELLLLNIAMLPRLLPLENASSVAGHAGQGGSGQSQPGQGQSPASARLPDNDKGAASAGQAGNPVPGSADAGSISAGSDAHNEAAPATRSCEPDLPPQAAETRLETTEGAEAPGVDDSSAPLPAEAAKAVAKPEEDTGGKADPARPEYFVAGQGGVAEQTGQKTGALPSWDAIFRICAEREVSPWLPPLLRKVRASQEDGVLVLTAEDSFVADRLKNSEAASELEPLLAAWYGTAPVLRVEAMIKDRKNREQILDEVLAHELVKKVEEHFAGAYVIDYGQLR